MPACSTDIGDEIEHQLDGVHRAHFCGIGLPKEMTGSAISRASPTDARAKVRVVRHGAMHTDPQLLFTVRMLMQEPRTP